MRRTRETAASDFSRVGSGRGRHRIPGLWLCVALSIELTLLGGCAHLGNWRHNGFKVGPDYCEPAVSVADEWIDFNDPQVISDACGAEEVAWWETFADPQLIDLVLTAHQQNLPLRTAELRIVEAEAQRAMAAGRLFPQFQEAFGSFEQRQRSPLGFSAGLPDLTRSLGVWTTGFNASWELDMWGRFRRGIASADAKVEASMNDYDDVLLALTADTAATYIELRAFQQRLRYNEENVAKQEESLALTQQRYKNGIVTKLDVTQAQSSLCQTKALAPVLQRGLRLANNRLCVLLGSPPINLLEQLDNTDQATLPTPPQQIVVGIPADLIRRRPDVRRSERMVASQSELIGIAASELFPSFSIGGSINWQAADFGDLFTPTANAGAISPGFNWNILNYGRIVNGVAVQDARFQQLAVQYMQTVLDANREVEDGIVDFLQSRERADELKKAVAAGVESLALAQLHYSEGWIDFDRVNNLQLDLVVQQDQSVVAQADILFGLIRIYRALGGGWQPRPETTSQTGDPNTMDHDDLPQPAPAESVDG